MSSHEPVPLTSEAAYAALRQLGCAPKKEGEAYTCPSCRAGTLTEGANRRGLYFSCTDGCTGVAGYLQAFASVPAPSGEHVDDLEVLREMLHLPDLVSVVKHGRAGNNYTLMLEGHPDVEIGPIEALLSQARFRARYIPQVRHSLPRYKAPAWDAIVDRIERVAEEEESSSTNDETLGWLSGYLGHAPLLRAFDVESTNDLFDLLGAAKERLPAFYDRDGRLHVRIEPLVQWLGRMAGVRATVPELSTRLGSLGFRRKHLSARIGAEQRRARYWISGPSFEERFS